MVMWLDSAAARAKSDQPKATTTAQLGQRLLLTSLGVLFLASVVAVLYTATYTLRWRAPNREGLPAVLWLSSGLIGATSAFMEGARRALRRNRLRRCQSQLLTAAGFALLFLVVQAIGARGLLDAERLPDGTGGLFLFCYYLLLSLHALHVLGGFFPLAWVLRQLAHGQYSSSRQEGLGLCVQYFHFLGAMWVLVLGTLWCVV